jgi:hypothetical protein
MIVIYWHRKTVRNERTKVQTSHEKIGTKQLSDNNIHVFVGMKQLSDNNIHVFTTEICFIPIFVWECLGVIFHRKKIGMKQLSDTIIHIFIGMKQLSDNNIHVFTTESCFIPIFTWECLGGNFPRKDKNETTFGQYYTHIHKNVIHKLPMKR